MTVFRMTDLSMYKRSAKQYADLYQEYLKNDNSTFQQRVDATWGLIANGEDAIPVALDMISSSNAEAREDGAAILAEIGKNDAAVNKSITALRGETDTTARDSIILALGSLKNRAAVPVLSEIIMDDKADKQQGQPLAVPGQ